MKKLIFLLLAVLSISLTTNAQTLSKEKKEKYQAKPSTQKKTLKRKTKKLAKSIKKHPLTENINEEDIRSATASTEMVYKEYLPKATATTPTVTHTIPTSGTIIYTAPNVGIGVITIQPYQSGWTTLGTVTPSFSYSIGIGEYSTNTDGSLDIQPYANLGAFVAAGFIPSINSASLQIGGALGVYKYNSIAIGYDIITHKPFVGIGAVISLSTFKKGLGSTILDAF